MRTMIWLFGYKELLAKVTKLDQNELNQDEDKNANIQEERVMNSNEEIEGIDDEQ